MRTCRRRPIRRWRRNSLLSGPPYLSRTAAFALAPNAIYAHLQTAPDEALAQELFALGSPQLNRTVASAACTTATSRPLETSYKDAGWKWVNVLVYCKQRSLCIRKGFKVSTIQSKIFKVNHGF